VSKEWGEVVGLVKEETGAVTQKVVTKVRDILLLYYTHPSP
jgi:hypothetical protein